MGTRIFEILLGTPAEVDDEIVFVSLASAGDLAAKSRLVYPGTSPALAPIVYFSNPDRRFGFDNEPIFDPSSQVIQTLDSQQLLSFTNTIVDVIIVETWTIDNGKFAMPIFMYRQLREYMKNPPDAGEFINWEPQNQSDKAYQVQLISLKAGTGPIPEAAEFTPHGQGGSVVAGPLDGEDVGLQNAGVIDASVELTFRLVAEVP